MKRVCALVAIQLLLLSTTAFVAEPVTTGSLLCEMTDLARLARLPEPGYRTVQFSSYDRRSSGPESPGWFSNADGFGREPIPGFAAVLRKPGDDGVGLYLLADVKGPGAVVRGWSAGMGGTLRVTLDGAEAPVWDGPAYEFLARRSRHFLERAGLEVETGDAFMQQDADYFPVPFAESLRVTWEGKVGELHFYHLQVRLYEDGTDVRTFEIERDIQGQAAALRAAVQALTEPEAADTGSKTALEVELAPGQDWSWAPEKKGPGAITELILKLEAEDLDEALRGVRLRLAFDGAMRPQVEAPVGDFFGSGPGINPCSSLPLSVLPDGTLVSRFVMPFAESPTIALWNSTDAAVKVEGSVRVSPWRWDDRSMYFRAKWRADHDLVAAPAAGDLPYAVVIGKGVFVGCAAMIMNPTGVPTAWGNWWGEGDEKILVDGESTPSTFGTGSEDYFNYSWSRPDLFDHPFCGQPLDSGPDTAGYVSNHRYQILDAIPFHSSLAVLLELWSHRQTPGLSYARIAYHYARPQAMDDHRALMPSDLRVPPLPVREPLAVYGAGGAAIHHFEDLTMSATAGAIGTTPQKLATRGRVREWKAEKGAKLTVNLPIDKAGKRALHVVAIHRPGGARLRATVGGKPLRVQGGHDAMALRTAHVARNLNVHFEPVELSEGEHALELECVEAGPVGLDYIWVK